MLTELSKLDILYVDDDAINLRVVEQILLSFGCHVTLVQQPRLALETLRSRPFHILLLDIHMPEMSGIELLQDLRRTIGPNRAAPAVALTADLTRDEVVYRELGFDGFAAKPVSVRLLLEKLNEVLLLQAAGGRQATSSPRRSRSGRG
jgi:CheY-like chemotaxis protein